MNKKFEYMQGTIVIMAICIVCFIVTTVKDGSAVTLVNYGGLFKPLIVYYNEVYRFITAGFLHADSLHLFLNLYTLYISGKILEPIFGTWKFLGIYFTGLLTGNFVSFAFGDVLQVSVGASGGIFGLFASIVLLTKFFPYHYGIKMISQQFLIVMIVNVVLGFTPGIDNLAHIGGLIGGVLGIYTVALQKKSTKYLLVLGTIILWGMLFYYGRHGML